MMYISHEAFGVFFQYLRIIIIVMKCLWMAPLTLALW